MACNLSPDPTGAADFTGATGKIVTVSAEGTSGTAQITGGFYAGKNIPVGPTSFTIAKDDQILDLVFENTLAGDPTLLLCDDGTVLDRFRFDRNNPARNYDVKGL
jgi:hypothetical protein